MPRSNYSPFEVVAEYEAVPACSLTSHHFLTRDALPVASAIYASLVPARESRLTRIVVTAAARGPVVSIYGMVRVASAPHESVKASVLWTGLRADGTAAFRYRAGRDFTFS